MTATTIKTTTMTTTGTADAESQAQGFASRRTLLTLLLLTLVYLCLNIDRGIVSVMLEPIKAEFVLSDSQLGLIPFAFSLFFVLAGVPLGILGDRCSRRSIIGSCLVVFSLATTLGGAAQNFTQLLFSRLVVGAGEAGCGPAAMAMISGLFPDRHRATAMSIYYSSVPVGFLLTFFGGGLMVAHLGWRLTFLAAGLPGLILAILVLFLVQEPVAERRSTSIKIPLAQMVRSLWELNALRHLISAIVVNALVAAAVMTWIAPFLKRSHGMPIQEAGPMIGLFYGLVSLLGVVFGGLLGDRLARRNALWQTRFLSLASMACAPLLLGTLLCTGTAAMLVFFVLWAVASSLWYGPAYAMTQSLVPANLRATLASIIYLLTSLIGVGLGAQLIGLLSDAFALAAGVESLRYALLTLVLVHLWAAWHFLLAGRSHDHG
ncbi:MFS transporter [Pseudomonas silvicola]|nr:MFS transporter [Pseudomonas silvicola]